MDYIIEGNVHALVIGKISIQELMFADDLTIGSFTVNGLQREIDQIVKFCSDWNLKCNLKKTKILVFKKGGETEKEREMVYVRYDQLIDVVNAISYLGITLESTGIR
jgi:hypothetical protein